MNRAYKVIYNKKRRLVQVVSEISGGFTRAERQGRRSLLRGLVLSCLVGASLIAAPLPSYAATTEEQVAANSAAIAQNKTNIAANKTAIESNQSVGSAPLQEQSKRSRPQFPVRRNRQT